MHSRAFTRRSGICTLNHTNWLSSSVPGCELVLTACSSHSRAPAEYCILPILVYWYSCHWRHVETNVLLIATAHLRRCWKGVAKCWYVPNFKFVTIKTPNPRLKIITLLQLKARAFLLAFEVPNRIDTQNFSTLLIVWSERIWIFGNKLSVEISFWAELECRDKPDCWQNEGLRPCVLQGKRLAHSAVVFWTSREMH